MKTIQALIEKGELNCHLCGNALAFHGSHERHCLDEVGERHDGWVAQCCCKKCGKYPTIIPDFLMPHKHYETKVVEDAAMDSEGLLDSGCPAEESTIRRWRKQWEERGNLAAGWLQSLLFGVFGVQVGSLSQAYQSVRERLRELLRGLGQPDIHAVAGRVNRILTSRGLGFL